MKRLGLTLVAAVCLTATTFAAGNQPTTAKWEGNINITKLSKYLNLDSNQHEEVANICEYFTDRWNALQIPRRIRRSYSVMQFMVI